MEIRNSVTRTTLKFLIRQNVQKTLKNPYLKQWLPGKSIKVKVVH